jgi:mRNA interferase HigB
MRIIKERFLKDASAQHPRAAEALDNWARSVRAAKWKNFAQIRDTFPKADQVRVKSQHTVYVFNIRGGEFRLIVAIHFDRQRLYTLRFLTHTQYDENKWKSEL